MLLRQPGPTNITKFDARTKEERIKRYQLYDICRWNKFVWRRSRPHWPPLSARYGHIFLSIIYLFGHSNLRITSSFARLPYRSCVHSPYIYDRQDSHAVSYHTYSLPPIPAAAVAPPFLLPRFFFPPLSSSYKKYYPSIWPSFIYPFFSTGPIFPFLRIMQ